MSYTKDDIRRICKEENIRYIRMMFTDMMGMLKNVEIPATRLEDALDNMVMVLQLRDLFVFMRLICSYIQI